MENRENPPTYYQFVREFELFFRYVFMSNSSNKNQPNTSNRLKNDFNIIRAHSSKFKPPLGSN